MLDIKIIDNFLPKYQFQHIQSIFLGDLFPWYYNEQIVNSGQEGYDPKSYQFTHTLFDRRPPWNGNPSNHFQYLKDIGIFKLLNVNEIRKVKVNLRPRTNFNRGSGWHVDFVEKGMTAIYYLNTCNGYTKFKKGGKVKSVENRIVIFDSQLYHQGYSCTDQKRRVVLNLNWI